MTYKVDVGNMEKNQNARAEWSFTDKIKFATFLMVTTILSLVFSILDTTPTHAVSLSITIPTNTISLNIVSTKPSGTFTKSNGSNFTVSTDNLTGYTLNIKSDIANGNDGSGKLLYNDSTSSGYYLSSIGNENNFPIDGISENIYKNGDTLNNITYNNTWAYRPSMINSVSNSNFLPAPDANVGDTINVTNCANGTENTECAASADTYSISLGAKVDSTVRVGSYSNTFVILATANAVPYTIIYEDNTVSNMPVDVSSNSQADTVSISGNVPVKNGYTFLGWCDTTPTTNNGVDSCPSGHTVYNPNGNGTNLAYTLDRTGGANNLHLYTMWSGGTSNVNYVPVTVNFAGEGANNITGVTFTGTYDNPNSSITFNDSRTVKASGTVIQLAPGVQYSITGTYSDGGFDSWSATAGTLGSTSSASTTYQTSTASTITLSALSTIPYSVTVTFGGNIDSAIFTNSTYGTETVTTSGQTITLAGGHTYDVTASTSSNKSICDSHGFTPSSDIVISNIIDPYTGRNNDKTMTAKITANASGTLYIYGYHGPC